MLQNGVIAVEKLEAWFDLEDNSGNQSIVLSEDFNDDQPSPKESKSLHLLLLIDKNISIAIKFSDNGKGESDSEDSFESYNKILCRWRLCNRG